MLCATKGICWWKCPVCCVQMWVKVGIRCCVQRRITAGVSGQFAVCRLWVKVGVRFCVQRRVTAGVSARFDVCTCELKLLFSLCEVWSVTAWLLHSANVAVGAACKAWFLLLSYCAHAQRMLTISVGFRFQWKVLTTFVPSSRAPISLLSAFKWRVAAYIHSVWQLMCALNDSLILPVLVLLWSFCVQKQGCSFWVSKLRTTCN